MAVLPCRFATGYPSTGGLKPPRAEDGAMSEDAYVPGVVRWLVVAGIAGTILVAAVVRPGQGIGRLGPFGLFTRDLWLHAGAYLVLELAVIYAVVGGRGPPPIPVVLTPVFVVAYGCLLEGVQLLLAYRSFSVPDIAANTVGVLLALGVYLAGAAAVDDAR